MIFIIFYKILCVNYVVFAARFVLTGHVSDSFIGGSAKAFNFRDEYDLDDDWVRYGLIKCRTNKLP